MPPRTTGHRDDSQTRRQGTGIPQDLCALSRGHVHIPFLSSPRNTESLGAAMHWGVAEERRRKVGEITKINTVFLGDGVSYPQSLGLMEGEQSGGSKRSSLGETRGKDRQKVSPGTSGAW